MENRTSTISSGGQACFFLDLFWFFFGSPPACKTQLFDHIFRFDRGNPFMLEAAGRKPKKNKHKLNYEMLSLGSTHVMITERGVN